VRDHPFEAEEPYYTVNPLQTSYYREKQDNNLKVAIV
jgi:hypothetical protein